MTRTDYAYRAAERKRRRDMYPDELGDWAAGFICLFIMMLTIFDWAAWCVP
jgi:hypothetical protein